MNNNKTAILSSFATMKFLNDSNKYFSTYQILSEFIKYIISYKGLNIFSSIEMKNYLNSIFGFNIPEAVIRSALKSKPYLIKKDGRYNVVKEEFEYDNTFEQVMSNSEEIKSTIIDSLVSFIRNKNENKDIVIDELVRDFIAFVMEDEIQKSLGRYTNDIGEFVLKNENNEIIQKKLRDIQEGSILYIGLNYNISEIGSIKKNLTLFLDTEVIFSLVGYNGKIYQDLAEDFYTQVRAANLKEHKITLKYFNEVKEEFDSFFNSAKSIVNGSTISIGKPAMKAILSGCKTESDVLIKESDFYHTLLYKYKITVDDKEDYYSEEYDKYNLENLSVIDPQEQDSLRAISHINKLRKGTIYTNNIESEFLLVTNTKSTLAASKNQVNLLKDETKQEFISDFAVSLDRATNILWYKLGNGFGKKGYPTNVNAIIKAKIILADNISHNVREVFEKAKSDYNKNLISEEELASRILFLRRKSILPETLESESIDDMLNFSNEYIDRFEEEIITNKNMLLEKDKALEKLKNEKLELKILQESELSKKEKDLSNKEEIIKKKDAENANLLIRIKELEKNEASQIEKINKKRKRIKTIILLVVKIIAIISIISLIYWLVSFIDNEALCVVLNTFSIFGSLITLASILKKDIKLIYEYF